MEHLHTYSDGSHLFKMSARALTQIPIWKGNRILDKQHAENIKKAINNQVHILDSGFRIIQYNETDQESGELIKKSAVIDGQHRVSIIRDYFNTNPLEKDFQITVTELQVDSEEDAIEYFNKINNSKPIQYEVDDNLLINKFIQKLCNAFPKNKNLIRITPTRRPYLHVDKLRNSLKKYVSELRKITPEEFTKRVLKINEDTLKELSTFTSSHKEYIMVKKCIEVKFALAWEDQCKWVKECVNNI
jgi:hypothetical protein